MESIPMVQHFKNNIKTDTEKKKVPPTTLLTEFIFSIFMDNHLY